MRKALFGCDDTVSPDPSTSVRDFSVSKLAILQRQHTPVDLVTVLDGLDLRMAECPDDYILADDPEAADDVQPYSDPKLRSPEVMASFVRALYAHGLVVFSLVRRAITGFFLCR